MQSSGQGRRLNDGHYNSYRVFLWPYSRSNSRKQWPGLKQLYPYSFRVFF